MDKDDPYKKINVNELLKSSPEKLASNPHFQKLEQEYGIGDDAMAIIHNPQRLAAAVWADPEVALKLFEYKTNSFFLTLGTYPISSIRAKNCLRLLSNLKHYEKHEIAIPDASDIGMQDAQKDAEILKKFLSSLTKIFYNKAGTGPDKTLDALIENPAFCRALLKKSFHVKELDTNSENFLDGFLKEAVKRYPDAGEIMAAEQAVRLGLPFSYDTKTHIVSIDWPGRDVILKDMESALAQAESLGGKPPEELAQRVMKAKNLLQPWLDRKLRMLVIEKHDDEWQAKMLLALGANDLQYDKAYGFIANDDGWGVETRTRTSQLLSIATEKNLPNLTRILLEQRGEKKMEALFAQDGYGENLLHLAVKRASPEIVDYILNQAGERKSELLATKELDYTPLRWAGRLLVQLGSNDARTERAMRILETLQRHGAIAATDFESEVTQWARNINVKLPATFSELARRLTNPERFSGMGGI